jgi:glycosyltransferase involved in cell wall biosynthesis
MSLSIAIIMPAYNESACIEIVVEQWSSFLNQNFKDQGKLIVVNDGSRDNTWEILEKLSLTNPVLVAINQKNGGHGQAVVRGYNEAIKLAPEFVFQTDSDDQFVSDDVMKLWQQRNNSKFILGFRQQRFDAPFRLFVTRVLKYSMFLIYGTLIEDSNIPFRLIKTKYLKSLLAQLPNETPFAPNIFLAILAKKEGQNTFDIPITHKSRSTGEVSIQKMKLLKVCWQSFKELAIFRKELKSKVENLKKLEEN